MSNTQRSSSDIERDVEKRRSEIDETINELKDRLSPEAAADYGVNYLRGPGGKRLLGAVRDNPLAAVLALGGIGWLFYTASQPEEERRERLRARSRARYRMPYLREERYWRERDSFYDDRADFYDDRADFRDDRAEPRPLAGSTTARGAADAVTRTSVDSAPLASRTTSTGTTAGQSTLASSGAGSPAVRSATQTPSRSDSVGSSASRSPASPVTGTATSAGPRPGIGEPPFGSGNAASDSTMPKGGPSTGSATHTAAGSTHTAGSTSATGGAHTSAGTHTTHTSGTASSDEAKTKADAPGPAYRNDKTS